MARIKIRKLEAVVVKSRVNGSIFNEVTELRMLIEGPKQNAVGN